MATKYPEIWNALAREFHPDDVKVRKHDGLKYITARTCMNRLDATLGPENWECYFERFGEHAVKCALCVCLPDGTHVTKEGVGARSSLYKNANGKCDPGEDDKGGEADALKRAAVQFGIGRYLYEDGVPYYEPEKPTNGHANEPADVAPAKPLEKPKAKSAEAETRSYDKYVCDAAAAVLVPAMVVHRAILEDAINAGYVEDGLRDNEQVLDEGRVLWMHRKGWVMETTKSNLKKLKAMPAKAG